MSAPQANVQVTLSLPILRKGQHSGEPPVERLQFMLNFVSGVDDLDVDGIFGTEDRSRGPGLPAERESVGRRHRGQADLDVGCWDAGCCSPSLASLLARPSYLPRRNGRA